MDFSEIEELSKIILSLGLPKNDFALFGIPCPFCGKSDRIHRLESFEELCHEQDKEKVKRLLSLLKKANPGGKPLGVCKFCRNILALSGNRAESIADI